MNERVKKILERQQLLSEVKEICDEYTLNASMVQHLFVVVKEGIKNDREICEVVGINMLTLRYYKRQLSRLHNESLTKFLVLKTYFLDHG